LAGTAASLRRQRGWKARSAGRPEESKIHALVGGEALAGWGVDDLEEDYLANAGRDIRESGAAFGIQGDSEAGGCLPAQDHRREGHGSSRWDPTGGVESSKRERGAGVLVDSKADGYRRAGALERVGWAAGVGGAQDGRGRRRSEGR